MTDTDTVDVRGLAVTAPNQAVVGGIAAGVSGISPGTRTGRLFADD
jgi:hypothetical protein